MRLVQRLNAHQATGHISDYRERNLGILSPRQMRIPHLCQLLIGELNLSVLVEDSRKIGASFDAANLTLRMGFRHLVSKKLPQRSPCLIDPVREFEDQDELSLAVSDGLRKVRTERAIGQLCQIEALRLWIPPLAIKRCAQCLRFCP